MTKTKTKKLWTAVLVICACLAGAAMAAAYTQEAQARSGNGVYLKWLDDAGNDHPLQFIKVDITSTSDDFRIAYTNEYGEIIVDNPIDPGSTLTVHAAGFEAYNQQTLKYEPNVKVISQAYENNPEHYNAVYFAEVIYTNTNRRLPRYLKWIKRQANRSLPIKILHTLLIHTATSMRAERCKYLKPQ